MEGLIPAHAGKTVRDLIDPRASGAHPRSRGENRTGSDRPACQWGSSPLTRGKPLHYAGIFVLIRLIPAHAGKTEAARLAPGQHGAHPRSRGENEPVELVGNSDMGSSPLTRGKPLEGLAGLLSGRLIPAHAGKTQARPWKTWAQSAHPRSRGENNALDRRKHMGEGSSPLTRGKRQGSE